MASCPDVVWRSWLSYNDGSTPPTVIDSTWSHWNSNTLTAVTGTWYHWNTDTDTGSTASVSDDVVWGAWNKWYAYVEIPNVVRECDSAGLTVDERRRERRREIRRAFAVKKRNLKLERKRMVAAEISKREKALADERAAQLLLDLIGEEQYQVYKETGRLFVHGRKYDWMVHGYGRVQRLEKNKVVNLCVHLKRKWDFPTDDNVVAIALAAYADEKKLIKLAHITGEQSGSDGLPECAVMGGSGG